MACMTHAGMTAFNTWSMISVHKGLAARAGRGHPCRFALGCLDPSVRRSVVHGLYIYIIYIYIVQCVLI